MTPEVQAAIEELRLSYPGHRLDVQPEAQGGAYIVVHDLSLGEQYTPSSSWVGFLIDFQCPDSDVYPHYIDFEVRRTDGTAHGGGFAGPVQWPGRKDRQAWQISRRSNRWNPAVDTAALKLAKVLEWMRSR